jgi:hypothetical protein
MGDNSRNMVFNMQTKKLRLMNEKHFKKSCKLSNFQIEKVVFWVQ